MRRTFDWGVIAGILFLAALVVANAAISYRNTKRVYEQAAWVAHTQDVLVAAGETRAALNALDATRLMYLLTGDDADRLAFRSKVTDIRGGTAELLTLTADNPDQQARIAVLAATADDAFRQLELAVDVRRADGPDAVARLIADGAGRKRLADATGLVRAIEAAEADLLRDRQVETDRAFENAVLFGAASAVFGLVAVGLFVLALVRSARLRDTAAADVHREREWFRTTLTSIGDAVIVTDAGGAVTFLNPVAEHLTGWSAADAAGRPLADVFPIVDESTREDVPNPAVRALSDGVVVGLANHTLLIARDGTEHPIDDSAAPIRLADGRVGGAVLVFRDITERRRAERTLRDERERSEFVCRASGVGFWYCDLPFDVLQWDDRVKAHYWLPPDARVTIGLFYARIHPDDRGKTRSEIEASVANRTGYDSLYRTVDPVTGGERWVRAIGRTFYADDGTPRRFDGVTLDVTDQKRAEAAIKESHDRFAIVARATNDTVWDWDMRTDAVWWNEGVTALFGHPPGAVGPDAGWWYEQIHPDDRGRVVSGIHAVIDHGVEHWSDEYRFRRADGTYATVLDRGYAIQEGGTTVRLVGAMQDVTATRAAAAALKYSEARFRSLFESMNEGYCVVTPVRGDDGRAVDYRYVLANPALEQQTGLSGVVGKTAREVMPTHEPHWVDAYTAVAETGVPFRDTGYFADLGRWFEVSAYRVGGPAERLVGVLFSDVSARVRAAEAVRTRDERLQLLLGAATDYAVVIADATGRVVEWLGGAEAITGYTPAEACGQDVALLFTDADRAAGVHLREMATAARVGRAEDKRWHRKKGDDEFFADGVMVPLRGSDGAVRGFGKVFRDVTGRMRAEEGVRFLADASASLADLVDHESTLGRIAGIAVAGYADWCVVDMIQDGALRRLTTARAEPADVAARRATDESADVAARRVTDEPADVVARYVVRTGRPEAVFDMADPPAPPVKGDTEWADRIARLRGAGVVSCLCVPLLALGRVTGCVTFLSSSARRRFGPDEERVAVDLAARVSSAIENSQLYRNLQDQDRRKDEFLATLAHELRNPLAPIRMGVQIVRATHPADDRADRALTMMDRQVRHMVRLVDDLLDVARLSSGRMVLRKECVELAAVVEAAVETARSAVDAGGHQLAVDLPTEPVVLEADRTRLVQVLANLLGNAAKYTPPGGRIALSAERAAGEIAVTVADTGVGISADMLPRVFDMFAQVGSSLDRSQGGLGIGLTLVKRLVELHGGRVTAESDGPGRGCAFTVRVPASAPAARPVDPESSPPPVRSGESRRILIVDDNTDAADTLATFFGLLGHDVRVAHDGPGALRVLAGYRPHLIVLDIGLPGPSGHDLARRIRADAAFTGAVLVALTGWGQDDDRRRSREAGFDHHLTKPADPGELEMILAAIALTDGTSFD